MKEYIYPKKFFFEIFARILKLHGLHQFGRAFSNINGNNYGCNYGLFDFDRTYAILFVKVTGRTLHRSSLDH